MIHTFASSSSIEKVFPIGKGSTYRPLSLTITHDVSTETQYTAEVFNQEPSTRNLPSGINKVSSVRYFNVSKSSGANTTAAYITLNYGEDDGVSDPVNLRILKDDGAGNWINLAGEGTDIGSGSISSTTDFTSFSDFALGNASDGDNSLPVQLVNFEGAVVKNVATLTWATESELENLGFEIYRSSQKFGDYHLISS